jgi:hypothetical protein
MQHFMHPLATLAQTAPANSAATTVLVIFSVVALIAGLTLWAFGRRVLKPAMILTTGLCSAGLVTLMLAPLADSAGVSRWVLAGGGLVAGLILGVLVYRLAIGLVFGTLAASLGALIAAASTNLSMPDPNMYRSGYLVQDQSVTDADAPPNAPPDARPQITDPPTEAAAEAGHAIRDWLSDGWAQASPTQRRALLAGSGAGFVIGGLLGILLPAWTAGLVTAAVGAAVFIPAGVVLMHAASMPGREKLNLTPLGWILTWVILTLVGVAIQWWGLGKRKPEPAPAKPAA